MRDQRDLLILAIALVGVGLFGPITAHAEAGDGLRAGDLKLNPRLTLSGAYDENVFRLDREERANRVSTAPMLSIEPGLEISTIDPTSVDFSMDGSVEWEQYISQDPALQAQSGLQGAGNLSAVLSPQGSLSLTLSDDFTYRNEPPPYPSRKSWNRLVNAAGAEIGIHPGDRILEVGLGYNYVVHRYLTDNLQDLDKDTHEFTLDVAWKFLPKTALVLDTDAHLVRYGRAIRGRQGAGLRNVDSNPIHVRGGLSGLLSNRISVRLLGGHGWGLYDSGPTYRGLLALADITFKYGNLEMDNRVTAGYERSFSDSTVGNYFGYHRGYLELRQNLLEKRLGLSLTGSYTRRDYASFQTDTQNGLNVTENQKGEQVFFDDLEDNQLEVTAGVHGKFFDWWDTSLEYTYDANLSGNRIDVPASGNARYFRRYQRHYVMLSTTLKY
jgi:hypothetical protein